MTNLEKKRDFCDRLDFDYTINDSGKQVTVHLNTVAYEALKDNAIFLFSSFGSVSFVNDSVFGNDLEKANVETQHYLRLNDDNYNVTTTFYHTSCNIGIQSFNNDNILQIGGKTPVLPFLEKYLYPAVEIIRKKVNIRKETDKIKM